MRKDNFIHALTRDISRVLQSFQIDDCRLPGRKATRVQNSAYGLLEPSPRPSQGDFTANVKSLFLFHSVQVSSPVFRFIAVNVTVKFRCPMGAQLALVAPQSGHFAWSHSTFWLTRSFADAGNT